MIGEKNFRDSLSPKEGLLFWALRRGLDVSIRDLYATIHPDMREMAVSLQQRLLGGFFARINKRLKPAGYVIAPGQLRQSYRMWEVDRVRTKPKAEKKPRRPAAR